MMFNFKDYISKLDLEQLRDCRTIINREIINKLSPESKEKCIPTLAPNNIPLPVIIEKKSIEQLVGEPKHNFIRKPTLFHYPFKPTKFN